MPYCVAGGAFGDEGNRVRGVVVVTERAKVGVEDEVGLVAFAKKRPFTHLKVKVENYEDFRRNGL